MINYWVRTVALTAILPQILCVTLHHKTTNKQLNREDTLTEVEVSKFQQGLAQMNFSNILAEKPDLSQELFEQLLVQDSDLTHLLYSDMTALYLKVAQDFSNLVTVQKIGESWQRRDIHVLTLDARSLMASKKVDPKAPAKDQKDAGQTQAQTQEVKTEQAAANLEVSPANVMVELAQTGSKFFDLVSNDDESLQTQDEKTSTSNSTAQAKKPKQSKPQKTLDEQLLDDPEKVNEEDHHFHGEEYAQSNLEMQNETTDGQNSILITGTTHPRELLSMQAPVFVLLKLLHQGVVKGDPKYQQMLAASKYHFLPVLNVDGAALVESHYQKEKKVINKRKNMSPGYTNTCGEEDSGTDLNRNWPIDWKGLDKNNNADVCGEFWPGTEPLSEPENKALNDFVYKNKGDLKFIINVHTSGNDFVWPFNGRDPNDINTRAPGYLTIFNDISKNAPFPDGVMFGNSEQVMGEKMSGDCDDYMMDTYGIPSVTAELGHLNQYINDWKCVSSSACYDILDSNTKWMEYLFQNIGKVAAIVQTK